ncbi:hypothetical protein HKD37_06G015521 [Glycine soja]|uniref:Uncharacterized protein n=1 Tax=Glycine max TaxID=3847 RepID=K7KUJ0_SOYBN|nr:hypothetical protein GYH30_014790 [Glycine max]KAH1245369.1 hypothetical protein GmHk_06G015727 [Glycine max]
MVVSIMAVVIYVEKGKEGEKGKNGEGEDDYDMTLSLQSPLPLRHHQRYRHRKTLHRHLKDRSCRCPRGTPRSRHSLHSPPPPPSQPLPTLQSQCSSLSVGSLADRSFTTAVAGGAGKKRGGSKTENQTTRFEIQNQRNKLIWSPRWPLTSTGRSGNVLGRAHGGVDGRRRSTMVIRSVFRFDFVVVQI